MVPVLPAARVEVDSGRRYIAVNEAACELLGYSREELLGMSIDDISFPSRAHVQPMFAKFVREGEMSGIFALRRKTGEGIMVRFESQMSAGRSIAIWTHYSLLGPAQEEE